MQTEKCAVVDVDGIFYCIIRNETKENLKIMIFYVYVQIGVHFPKNTKTTFKTKNFEK